MITTQQANRIEGKIDKLIADMRLKEQQTRLAEQFARIEAKLETIAVSVAEEAEIEALSKRLNAQSDELKTATEAPA